MSQPLEVEEILKDIVQQTATNHITWRPSPSSSDGAGYVTYSTKFSPWSAPKDAPGYEVHAQLSGGIGDRAECVRVSIAQEGQRVVEVRNTSSRLDGWFKVLRDALYVQLRPATGKNPLPRKPELTAAPEVNSNAALTTLRLPF